jgi:lysophospholipase L1-like esterase
MPKIINVGADLRVGDTSTSVTGGTSQTRSWVLRGAGGNDIAFVLSTFTAAGVATPAMTPTVEFRKNLVGAWTTATKTGAGTVPIASGSHTITDFMPFTWVDGDRVEVRITSAVTVNMPQTTYEINEVGDTAGARYTPSGILSTQPDGAISVVGFGDSISAGTGRTTGQAYKLGVINTAYRLTAPCVSLVVPGGLLSSFVALGGSASFLAWLTAINPTDIFQEASINDIGAARTADQIAADASTMATRFATAVPGVRTWQTTTTPNNNTAVNGAPFMQRTRFNELVRAGIVGYAGFVDLARRLESARNSNAWVNNSFTTDNTHLTDSGYDATIEAFPTVAELTSRAASVPAVATSADSGSLFTFDVVGRRQSGTPAVVSVRRLGDGLSLPASSVTLTALGRGEVLVSRASGLVPCVAIIDLDSAAALPGEPSSLRFRAVILGTSAFSLVSVVDPRNGELIVGTQPTITDSVGVRPLHHYGYGSYVLPNENGGTVALDPAGWYSAALGTLTIAATPASFSAPTVVEISDRIERTGGPLALVKTITDRVATLIGQIGTSGVWRFLQSAFPTAPSGWGPALFGAADIEWELQPIGPAIIPSTSVEYVKCAVEARRSGRVLDPTAYELEFAFVESIADLPSATYYPAEWDEDGVARLLIGPGQTPALAAGLYLWYVRVATSPETTVRRLPLQLRIE